MEMGGGGALMSQPTGVSSSSPDRNDQQRRCRFLQSDELLVATPASSSYWLLWGSCEPHATSSQRYVRAVLGAHMRLHAELEQPGLLGGFSSVHAEND